VANGGTLHRLVFHCHRGWSLSLAGQGHIQKPLVYGYPGSSWFTGLGHVWAPVAGGITPPRKLRSEGENSFETAHPLANSRIDRNTLSCGMPRYSSGHDLLHSEHLAMWVNAFENNMKALEIRALTSDGRS